MVGAHGQGVQVVRRLSSVRPAPHGRHLVCPAAL
jgi:hypothetical protein